MSDSDTPPGRHGATAGTTAQMRWWRWWRGWDPRLVLALWRRKPPQTGTDTGSGFSSSPRRAGIRMWMLIVFGILVCLPIVGIVLGYMTRPPAGTVSIVTGGASSESSPESAGKIPKPAPGRPMGAPSQAPPPIVASSTPTPIAPESPSQMAIPQRPVAPMSTPAPAPTRAAPPPPVVPAAGKTPFAAVTYPARHDKHFGGECEGQLTLNSTGLLFDCPGDPGGRVQVAINQIDSVDDNGIRLTSGKKYHFTIPGMNKGAEKTLFADWLGRVR